MADSSTTGNPGTYSAAVAATGPVVSITPGAITNDPNGAITLDGLSPSSGYLTVGQTPGDPFAYPAPTAIGNISTSAYTASFGTWFKTSAPTYNGSGNGGANGGAVFSNDALNNPLSWNSGVVGRWTTTGGATINDTLGSPNVNDEVFGKGQLITLSGSPTNINFLGYDATGTLTGVNTPIFQVHYNDGSSQLINNQSMTSWTSNPAGFAGETSVAFGPTLYTVEQVRRAG